MNFTSAGDRTVFRKNLLAFRHAAVVTGNKGNGLGFGATVTRTNGTTTNAAAIYFKTDGQTAIPNITPGFTPAAGVDKLPQLPGSGQMNSIAWKASNDNFAPTTSPRVLRSGLTEQRRTSFGNQLDTFGAGK